MTDLLNMLYWRETNWFWLNLLPIILWLIHHWQQKNHWLKLANPNIHPWLRPPQTNNKPYITLTLFGLAWFCFVLALAGPRLVKWVPPEQQTQSATLIVILDLSASMNAEDIYPSRKARAIQWLQQASNNAPKSLKTGIVVFAGHAFSLMPPTLDKNITQHFIQQLNELKLPTLGNDLTAALNRAKQHFNPNDREQHIIVLTDGDLSPDEQQRTHTQIKQTQTVYTTHFIGFGSQQNVPIPTSNGGFVLANNRPVESRLHSAWLNQMGQLNNVTYHPYQAIKAHSLKQLLQLKPVRLTQRSQQYTIWHELFPYPVILGIAFLLLNLFLYNKNIHSWLYLGFSLGILISHSPNSQASEHNSLQAGIAALNAQQFQRAQKIFKQINTPKSAFGEGIACYRQNDFQCAVRAFSKAAWQEKSPQERAKAVFNLGNSYFFLGDYQQASVLYQDAKNLGFDARTAQHNLNFATTMQHAVQQRIKDIKALYRRAKWRAAATNTPEPTLSDIISSQQSSARTPTDKKQHFILRQAIQQQVSQQLGIQTTQQQANSQWIQSEYIANQSTAHLLKRLLEMELAIPASLQEPQKIKGKRPW